MAARAKVPAPDVASTSAALDELTGSLPRLVQIPIGELHPHPQNPRRDLGVLDELAESIKAAGIRQPLTVVPHDAVKGHGNKSGYLIVIGHRRAAAAQLAGLAAVPAIVDESLTAAQQLELMLVENIQRADLSAVEEADGYQGLLDLGLDEAAIAAKTGRSKATVHARLQLVGLPKPAREKVHAHQATLDDAMLLAKTLEDKKIAARLDVVEELNEGLGRPNFDWLVRRKVGDVKAQAEHDALVQKFTATGVRVVKPDLGTSNGLPKGVKPLGQLTDQVPTASNPGAPLDPEAHASCPGHVVWFLGIRNDRTE